MIVNANRIKVVWICSVSNQNLRDHLNLKRPFWFRLLRRFQKRKCDYVDYAKWNTNAIEEFDKISEVDLHVIFTHSMQEKEQRFKEGHIWFYAVNSGTNFFSFFKQHFCPSKVSYVKTWRRIESLVTEINPQIIHVMGAENPNYSLSSLLLSKQIPVIVQLQTMLNDPMVVKRAPDLKYQIECEKKVLLRADYIGTKSVLSPRIIREFIKKDSIIINTSPLIAENVNMSSQSKQFDFVYFAGTVNKAIDLVLEAFGIAHNNSPSLTLDVIGDANESELVGIRNRIKDLGCEKHVTLEGVLPTHEDVMRQIRKARFALLPLKIDAVSGTIREAMWNGLPVLSTITQGTPRLNEKRESILLSPIGDHVALANNMLRIANDKELAEKLRNNAALTVDEMYGNNAGRAQQWLKAYYACIDNFYDGIPLPDDILNKN